MAGASHLLQNILTRYSRLEILGDITRHQGIHMQHQDFEY